jgi:hypothetical protein
MREVMPQDGFREKVKGNNGHVYLKVLKEEIAKELQIAEKGDVKDYQF